MEGSVGRSLGASQQHTSGILQQRQQARSEHLARWTFRNFSTESSFSLTAGSLPQVLPGGCCAVLDCCERFILGCMELVYESPASQQHALQAILPAAASTTGPLVNDFLCKKTSSPYPNERKLRPQRKVHAFRLLQCNAQLQTQHNSLLTLLATRSYHMEQSITRSRLNTGTLW